MSEDRYMGLMWGLGAGIGLLAAFTVHPLFILFSIGGIAACYSFGKSRAVGTPRP
jgi:hypothetical protein